MEKILYQMRYLTAAVAVMGLVFKIMHWPGASVCVIAGGLGLSVALLLSSLNNPKNKK